MIVEMRALIDDEIAALEAMRRPAYFDGSESHPAQELSAHDEGRLAVLLSVRTLIDLAASDADILTRLGRRLGIGRAPQ